jgi:hypothetical protein
MPGGSGCSPSSSTYARMLSIGTPIGTMSGITLPVPKGICVVNAVVSVGP